jgi:hypothetical protein
MYKSPPWRDLRLHTSILPQVYCTNYLCTYDLYSPVCNVFDAGRYITWASGRGLGPGNGEFFGPCEMTSGQVPFGAQKKFEINHRCMGGFMYKSPPWRDLRVHTSILPYVCITAYYLTCAYQHTYVCIHIC